MPVDNPTVPKAEVDSNNKLKKWCPLSERAVSVADSRNVDATTTDIPKNIITAARRYVSRGIVLPKTFILSLL